MCDAGPQGEKGNIPENYNKDEEVGIFEYLGYKISNGFRYIADNKFNILEGIIKTLCFILEFVIDGVIVGIGIVIDLVDVVLDMIDL